MNIIMLYRCIHCRRVTLLDEGAPGRNGDCECGGEWHPIARRIELGKALTRGEIAGEALGRWIEPEEGDP